MLQLYFLSVAANLLAGSTLSADWISKKFTSLTGILGALSARRARMTIGLMALLVGLCTLFFPGGKPIIIGDLFPSVVGIAVGIALLFEVLRQEAQFPGEQVRAPSPYRLALGAFAFAAAVLHFFLPERLFL